MTLFEDLKLNYKIGGISMKIIYWNIILFVLPETFTEILKWFNINFDYIKFVSITSNISNLWLKPWSLITYCFFHKNLFHILFNMLMLYFTGRLFLTFFNSRQFIGLYFLGAIFSAIIYILSYSFLPFLNGYQTEMIGASGAIMAIFFATVTYQPQMSVWLFSVWKLPLWQIAFLFCLIDLVQLSTENTGGHIAHLSGAFFGFIFIKLLKNGIDLSKFITVVPYSLNKFFKHNQKNNFKKVYKNYNKNKAEDSFNIKLKDKTQQKTDEILDKISKSGYDSLDSDEKNFLFKVSK